MMPRDDDSFDQSEPRPRPPYRPPIGMPARRDSYGVGTIVSLALHGVVLLFILAPFFVATMLAAPPDGAGGAGPAGGGGGGTGGSGGAAAEYRPETLRYIQISPAPEAAPAAEEAEAEPVLPVPPPPEPEPEPEPTPPPVSEQIPPATPAEPLAGSADAQVEVATAPTPGTGGGTGDDGTSGTGPGSGGGIGSGVGTGRGSGDGPGTGGGNGEVYLPTATLSVFPNRKPRNAVPGDSIKVLFDVDSTGRVLRVEFTPTKDRGFNKYLEEVLDSWEFRPAHRPDGTPVRATYPIAIVL